MSVQLADARTYAALTAASYSVAQCKLYTRDAPDAIVRATVLIDANIHAWNGAYPLDKVGETLRSTMIPTFAEITRYTFDTRLPDMMQDRTLIASVYQLAAWHKHQINESHCEGVAVCQRANRIADRVLGWAGRRLAGLHSESWGEPGDRWERNDSVGLLRALDSAYRAGGMDRVRGLCAQYPGRVSHYAHLKFLTPEGVLTATGAAHMNRR